MNSRAQEPREIFTFLSYLCDDTLMETCEDIHHQLETLDPLARDLLGLPIMHALGIAVQALEARGYDVGVGEIPQPSGQIVKTLLYEKRNGL